MGKQKKTKFLLESTFEWQPDVDCFFVGEDFKHTRKRNLRIYEKITKIFRRVQQGKRFEKYRGTPLIVLNFLHEQVDILWRYRRQPTKIIDHLRSIPLEDQAKSWILAELSTWRIFISREDDNDVPAGTVLLPDHFIRTCQELIKQEYESIWLSISSCKTEDEFTFEILQSVISLYPCPDDKIYRLIKRINEARQELASPVKDAHKEGVEAFIKKCESEIETIKRLKAEGYYGKEFVTNAQSKSTTEVTEKINEESLKEEQSAPPATGKTEEKQIEEDPPFEVIFSQEGIPSKLIPILQSDEIGWLNGKEEWISRGTEAVALSFFLWKYGFYKPYVEGFGKSTELYPTRLCRIYNKRFKATISAVTWGKHETFKMNWAKSKGGTDEKKISDTGIKESILAKLYFIIKELSK
jgi:hypothetical protein